MFKIRTSKPSAGNKHYIRKADGGFSNCIKGKPTDKNCNVLANCVGYAIGRASEIYSELTNYQGNYFNFLQGDAENFVKKAVKNNLTVSKIPKPGAIMCWAKGKQGVNSDGAGHVCVVEKVNDNGSVYTSESGYNTKAFWNATRTNKNGRWGCGSAYTFLGFIYNPSVKDEPKVEPTPSLKPVDDELKVGDKVKIISKGNGSSYGTSNTAGGIGWTRYITKIYEGRPFPYQVGNKDKTDSKNTTGFYAKSALKKI